MKRKILILIGIGVVAGIAFLLGLLVGWGMLASVRPPESALTKLLWETRDTLKERYFHPEELDDTKLLYGAMKGLVEASGDPYSAFFTPEETKRFLEDVSGHFEGIGAEIGFRNRVLTIIAPLPGTPAERAGLQAGDMILKIDDESTEHMTLEEAVSRIRGPAGSEVTLQILREDAQEPQTVRLTRARIDVPSLTFERRKDAIAIIRLSSFAEDAPARFREAASALGREEPRGIILDLRNNPGGFLDGAVEIAGWLLPPQTPVVIERQRQKNDEVLRTEGPGTLASIPLVVLVNGGTASAAEILAGALNEERGVPLIGEETFGKGTIQEFPALPGGAALKVTVGEWLTPNGTSLRERGLQPSIAVRDDPATDEDEILERAIAELERQITR